MPAREPERQPSFDELLLAHLSHLRSIVQRHARNLLRHETEDDLVQGIVASALKSAPRFRFEGEPQLLAWLRKTALRHLRDRRDYWLAGKRAPAHKQRITTSDPSTLSPGHGVNPTARTPGPATTASQKEEQEAALRAISTLSPRDREILQWLKEGLDRSEMAEKLGISSDAADQARKRAIERFRKAYEASRNEETS